MRKTNRIILLAVFLLALLTCSAALAQDARVFDDANLFSEEQRASLEESVAALREQTGMDAVIVTTADAQGKSARDYADDYYDQNGFGADGALFLIDMDNREAYISTAGRMIDYLTDKRIQSILDDAYAGLKGEDYAAAAQAFVDGMGNYVEQGIPAGQHREQEATANVPKRLTMIELLIALGLAVVVGLIVRGSVIGSYHMRTVPNNYSLVDKGAMNLGACEDLFLNQTITSVRIPRNDDSNRSSTHTSSGGSTHGGGGRSF